MLPKVQAEKSTGGKGKGKRSDRDKWKSFAKNQANAAFFDSFAP